MKNVTAVALLLLGWLIAILIELVQLIVVAIAWGVFASLFVLGFLIFIGKGVIGWGFSLFQSPAPVHRERARY
ncbi:MAG: hypothetical protein SFT92_02045 [Rickettsiales bacterium]|nr:hypothetical protein [Rickettsiales bacterium]